MGRGDWVGNCVWTRGGGVPRETAVPWGRWEERLKEGRHPVVAQQAPPLVLFAGTSSGTNPDLDMVYGRARVSFSSSEEVLASSSACKVTFWNAPLLARWWLPGGEFGPRSQTGPAQADGSGGGISPRGTSLWPFGGGGKCEFWSAL